MGENSTSGNGLKVVKGHDLDLSTVSLASSGADEAYDQGTSPVHPPRLNLHRQYSENSSIPDVAEDIESAELQKRLFQQKYNALKVQKEKKKIDRNIRNFGKPRDKYFQLPDEVQFALSVACGSSPTPPVLKPLPQILNEGVVLFAPDADDTPRADQLNENGTTARREKEVRIVEHISPNGDSPSKTPLNSVKTSAKKKNNKQNLPTEQENVNGQTDDSNKKDSAKRKGSGKRTASAASHPQRNHSGKGAAGRGSKHRGIWRNRLSSGNSEGSQSSHTCSRPHSRTKPCSRPTSTSSTLSFKPRLSSSKRKQSKSDEAHAQHRRRSRAASSGTLSQPDSENSDHFESDSELEYELCDDLSLFPQESLNISRIDLTGNALPEPCLSYLCEVMEENLHIKDLNLSECQADREGVGDLVKCLQHSNTLTSLDISGIRLCVEQVQIISEYIQNSSALHRLGLSYCEVGEAGATVLADALGSTICLSYLDLSWNQLRHKGALQFCMALKDNDTIQNLDLSWNGLGRDGCMGLEVALGSNTVLRHLDISSNRIGVLGLEVLLKGLHKNTTLNSIKIGNNPLPTESGTAIMNTIISCPESTLCMLDMSHIAVADEFLGKLTEVRKSRVFYVFHGHVLSGKADPYAAVGNRSLTSFDPVLVLFEYMKLQNMRLLDLFRSIDTNGDKVISREELRAVFLSLNMSLPTGTFEAMFRKMDLNQNNVIDIDEMKVVHRRVMRQARALKARAAREEEDEFGDATREFQDLVRQAVVRRRSRRGSSADMDLSKLLDTASPRTDDTLRVMSPSRRRSSLHGLTPSPSLSRRSSGASETLTAVLSLDVKRRSAKSRSGSFTGSTDLS